MAPGFGTGPKGGGAGILDARTRRGNWTAWGACAREGAMNNKPAPPTEEPCKPGRDDRLKAALKANMARRKAQARARTDAAAGDKKAED